MGDLVSIITPAYNSAKYLSEAIESVLSQTYPNWEMIIVDDGSDDETAALAVENGDPRIRCFVHPVRRGVAEARNTALRKARGRWVAFLDSDEVWESDKLERQVRFMEANGIGFSYTDYIETDENGKPNGRRVSGPKHIGKWGMYGYCWPGCLTVMYDTTKTGLIQAASIDITDDYALWLQIAKKTGCHLLHSVLARHRVVPESLSDRGYCYKIRCHYNLFRRVEGMPAIVAMLFTFGNLLFGTIKKLIYVNRAFNMMYP